MRKASTLGRCATESTMPKRKQISLCKTKGAQKNQQHLQFQCLLQASWSKKQEGGTLEQVCVYKKKPGISLHNFRSGISLTRCSLTYCKSSPRLGFTLRSRIICIKQCASGKSEGLLRDVLAATSNSVDLCLSL